MDSRPWDFQAEECALRAAVDRFNYRRYTKPSPEGSSTSASDKTKEAGSEDDFPFEPVDNCLASVLSQEVDLTDEFKRNYERWLHKEVYSMEIQWELLLDSNGGGGNEAASSSSSSSSAAAAPAAAAPATASA